MTQKLGERRNGCTFIIGSEVTEKGHVNLDERDLKQRTLYVHTDFKCI